MSLQVQTNIEIAETSNSVLERIFSEISILQNQNPNEDWFRTCINYLNFFSDIEVGFGHAKATMLAVIKDNWDNLPLDIKKQHGYSFDNFAKLKTGGKAKSTYEGYILTARIWIIEEFGKNRNVQIHERAEDGKAIIESGKPVMITKEFIPYEVDFSKLTILNARAREGEITEKLWEMLVDDFYTCDDLRLENSKDKEGNPHQYTLTYHTDGPLLCVTRNGNTASLCEINWEEYETNPLVQEGIDNLFKYFKIQMDEDAIFNIIHQGQKENG